MEGGEKRGEIGEFRLNSSFYVNAMLKHVIDIGWTSVCLSVCHTLARYQNG